MLKYPLIPMLALLVCAASARAQCAPEWSAPWTSNGIAFGGAGAFAQWDPDGAGPLRPMLVAAGGDRGFNLIGAYDGRDWRWLGEGLGIVGSLEAAYVAQTTGVGSPAPGLYVGGSYRRAAGEPSRSVSHWDGTSWNHVGQVIGTTHNLLMFDEDGPGPNESNLFVAGGLLEVAGLRYPGLYRLDGTTFSLVGGSLQAFPGQKARAKSMTIFDDVGPGPRPPALYVAGSFETAGGLVVNNIARWDGQNWEALDLGISSGVDALAVFDDDGDGPGLPMLYAAGRYRTPGGNHTNVSLSRWDGTQWSEMPGYGIAGVEALHVHDDDGDGPNKPALFVSGLFSRVNGVYSPGLIKWDGTQWLAVGGGLGGVNRPFANAMSTFDEDGDPATPPGLYVGGSFFTAGGLRTPGLARWGCWYSTCYADCDKSTGTGGQEGVLDIFDFLCFQHAFVTSDPYACDCDVSTGNGVCDMLDFLCFQRAFVAGCP